GLSPVVPTGTRPWVPSASCQETSARKAASSSEPFLNGVTKAVKEPRKFVLAAMELLRTQVAVSFSLKNHFIPGLKGRRKARYPALLPRRPYRPSFCRGANAKGRPSRCSAN